MPAQRSGARNIYLDEDTGKQLDFLLLIERAMRNEPEFADMYLVADLIAREYERKRKAFDEVMQRLGEGG